MKLTIKGRLPGLNEYISTERTNRQKAAKLKREAEAPIILLAKRRLHKVKSPVVMHYTWYERDRRRDKDNIAFAKKFIQDALVKAGILENDGWEQIEGFTDSFRVDRENPRVEVEIKEIGHEI